MEYHWYMMKLQMTLFPLSTRLNLLPPLYLKNVTLKHVAMADFSLRGFWRKYYVQNV